MKKDTVGNLVIGFGILNSLLLLLRIYIYFFTGKDISQIQDVVAKGGITFVMFIMTGLCYLIGYGLKGKLDID